MVQFADSKLDERIAELHRGEIEERVRMMGAQLGVPYINLIGVTINPEALSRIPENVAREREMVAFMESGTKLMVGMKNPNNPAAKQEAERLRGEGLTVEVYIVSEQSLQHAYERYADITEAHAERHGGFDIDTALVAQIVEQIQTPLDVDTMIHTLETEEVTESVSKAVSILFAGGHALDASDVHIEPEEGVVRVRYRLDGVLSEVTNLPHDLYPKILSRIKLLAGMKLNIRNEAQDGRLSFSLGDDTIDVRVSVIPGGNGESIVMRLLNPDVSRFKLENLGFNETLLEVVKKELARPNGAIITTGPTGSGKTTALYSFLQQVLRPGVKIITIEDPIEYKLPGVVQTQTDKHYSFASGLRAVLRQDPDIIMVGEIRDLEVAETTVHAALTGHLVLSTLHTNSAIGAIPRLIDIGVEPSIIGSAFNLVLGQRLVRKLCDECKEARPITPEEQKIFTRMLGEAPNISELYHGKGCAACGMSGFKGRVGVFEAVQITPDLAQHIEKGVTESALLEYTKIQGIPSMQEDALMKVMQGVTSLEEVERVIDLFGSVMASARE